LARCTCTARPPPPLELRAEEAVAVAEESPKIVRYGLEAREREGEREGGNVAGTSGQLIFSNPQSSIYFGAGQQSDRSDS
jgi:hypothetical protein